MNIAVEFAGVTIPEHIVALYGIATVVSGLVMNNPGQQISVVLRNTTSGRYAALAMDGSITVSRTISHVSNAYTRLMPTYKWFIDGVLHTTLPVDCIDEEVIAAHGAGASMIRVEAGGFSVQRTLVAAPFSYGNAGEMIEMLSKLVFN